MQFRDFLSGRFLETTPSPRLAGAVAVFLVVIWGTTWAAIRFSLDGFPPFLSMSLRFGMAPSHKLTGELRQLAATLRKRARGNGKGSGPRAPAR